MSLFWNCLRLLNPLGARHYAANPPKVSECYMPICGVEIKQAPPSSNEKCRVAAFLKANFFGDDPVMKAAGFDPTSPDPAIVEFFLQLMNDRRTYYAMVQESRELLGVLISHVTTPTSVYELKVFADRLRNDAARRYVHYLAQIEERANIYKSLAVDKVLKVDIVCTGKRYRRRGICKQLLKYSSDLAKKEKNFDIIRFDTGNLYAGQGAKKIPEMKSWSKKLLPTYKDARGVPWLKHDLCPPHRDIEVIVANIRPPKKKEEKEWECDMYGLDKKK